MVAEAIVKELNCEIEAIVDTQKRTGAIGFIRSGYQALKERITTLEPLKSDPATFELVLIGTPVWAGRISVPARTFIVQNKEKLKEVAFFFTSGGKGNEQKIFPAMEQLCGKKPRATLGVTSAECKKELYLEKVKDLTKAIKS